MNGSRPKPKPEARLAPNRSASCISVTGEEIIAKHQCVTGGTQLAKTQTRQSEMIWRRTKFSAEDRSIASPSGTAAPLPASIDCANAMFALVVLQFLAAAIAPALIRWLDRRAFLLLALAPLAGFIWALRQTAAVTGSGSVPVVQSITWIDALDFQFAFQLGVLNWLMMLLVTGIGALVLAYCAAYFPAHDGDLWRFSAVLTAFAGAMLGLVLSDDLLLLYVFWELTSVLSYLLIGHNPERRANRRAAMSALMVTAFGGLTMLLGIIVLGGKAGSYRLSDIASDPPSGTAVTVAVLLILVGAVSKSALVPFHFWLPGAMAAPTPVSAYLHAAAMVKAGVYLIAVLAPIFAATPGWRPALMTLGLVTMLVGGLRALRQYDVKLLLAYGTVSQLGFLIAMVGTGTRAAALAGLGLVLAHALFKSTLFLVVGIVDHSTGTRDLRELSGLRRQLPGLLVITILAAASMAGVPPLLGFTAKESGFAAFGDLGRDVGWGAGWLLLVVLVIGSTLTVAYTARLVWGIFGNKSGCEPGPITAPSIRFQTPPAILAAACLVLGFSGAWLTERFTPYLQAFPSTSHEPELALWHGFTVPLLLSILCLGAGVALFIGRRQVAWLQHVVTDRVRLPNAERAYYLLVRGLERLAVEVTARTQQGSLPRYMSIIVLVVITVPGSALAMNRDWGQVRGYDTVAQVVVGILIIISAIETVRSRRRLRAVLLLGATGYGTAVLFILHGAPDLALTQVLVETFLLVAFVLVLRRLPPYFSNRRFTLTRWIRIGIGCITGLVVGGFALAATTARSAAPISAGFAEPAVSCGGGRNIVNVTLVDIRAWDTLGELSVLVVAATGVASLIFLITGRTSRLRPSEAIQSHTHVAGARTVARRTWLRAGRTQAPHRRSVVFEVVTRLLFHSVIVFSAYLLFAGHNSPGGGFAGGLVVGLALTVRYLAGGRHELDEAAPIDAGVVLGLGLTIAAIAGLVPTLIGGQVLQSAIVDLQIPFIGGLHVVTSTFFDIGVYLVVVGLALDVLRSLGGGIDQDSDADVSVSA